LNTTSVQTQIFDADNNVLIPDEIKILDVATVRVTFAYPILGRAVLLSGHNDGNTKPTFAFVFEQTVASDTWVVLHGLARQPITRVFIGNQEVQPASIVHDSDNQLTITFNQPYTGVVKLI